MAASTTVGTRLTCGQCGTEVIVVKVPEGELTCCGARMTPLEKK
jgi:Desulfoferrodoxin, N-terminal domain